MVGLVESELLWQQRLQMIRDYLTDFYFAYNLPLDLFHAIIGDLLDQRSVREDEYEIHFNPELAPLDLLLKQAAHYESLPQDEQAGRAPPPARRSSSC